MELNQIQFNCFSNFNHWNAPHFTCTLEAFHTYDHLGYKIQILANATWHNLNYIWSLNLNSFSNQLQLRCDKLKLDHIITINIIMCLSIAFYLPWLLCLLDRRATGIGDHPLRWRYCYRTSSARQAAPPLIMLIKSHFPLLPLCMIRMVTLYRFLPHSWTHILCMAYHLVIVVSKTTILADVGVDWYHVAPANVTSYCMLRVTMRLLFCESGW